MEQGYGDKRYCIMLEAVSISIKVRQKISAIQVLRVHLHHLVKRINWLMS